MLLNAVAAIVAANPVAPLLVAVFFVGIVVARHPSRLRESASPIRRLGSHLPTLPLVEPFDHFDNVESQIGLCHLDIVNLI